MTTVLENQLRGYKLQQTLEDLAELGQMAIRKPHLALPLILVACGLNTPVATTKTPEISPPTQGITETVADTETPEESETPESEVQLFPTSWEQRYQLNFSDSLSNPEVYDQLSQILADNAAQILADDTHGIGICGAIGTPILENPERLTPSAIHFDFSNSIINAIHEVQTPEGTSYVITISCKGPGEAEVLPKAVNLYFSWDLVQEYGGDSNYIINYIKYLLETSNTSKVEDRRVATWGGSSFDIPSRPDSQAVAREVITKNILPVFARFVLGNLVQDPAFPETTDAGAIEALSPNLIVVHSLDNYP